MIPRIFLDTNVILDYLEGRRQEVKQVVRRLLEMHEKGTVELATTVMNVAELIDKEFEIHFLNQCLSEKMTSDEIYRKMRDRQRTNKAYVNFVNEHRSKVGDKVEAFIAKNGIGIVAPDGDWKEDFYMLVQERRVQTQDAFIVATILSADADYFLTNDEELRQLVEDLINTYNLRRPEQLEDFRNSVLEAIA